MSEELLIEHCSPTLAGIKTGNLFSCQYNSINDVRNDIRYLNHILVPKGVRVVPMKFCNNRALIYVFRPSKLYYDLTDIQAYRILTDMGYNCQNVSECVAMLAEKLHKCQDFPHEIGLFLGYPPEDVSGFIENSGNNSKYTGCWKVYGDKNAAIKKFKSYKKCKDIYCNKWKNGTSIQRLTVVV